MSYDEQYSYKWDMWDSRTPEEVAADEAATQRLIYGYEPEGVNMRNEHITKESFTELETLAKPLQDWMMDNFNMMCKVEITCDYVTVLSPEIGLPMMAKGL